MTIGETATLSAFDANAYSVSDSGSALSVTSASISGLVITLNLSRAIPTGATVTFAYSTSGIAVAGRWVDAAGNQLNNVTSRTITNNSSVPISVGLTVADSITKSTSITISASATVAGRVTFTIAGKRIQGCYNKVASGTTPITVTCAFKPALTGWQKITATLVPTLGAYPTTISSVDRFISKRTNLR
jgi:phage tail sheath gpL-like